MKHSSCKICTMALTVTICYIGTNNTQISLEMSFTIVFPSNILVKEFHHVFAFSFRTSFIPIKEVKETRKTNKSSNTIRKKVRLLCVHTKRKFHLL